MTKRTPNHQIISMTSWLNPFIQHGIKVPLHHHIPPMPQNHLKQSIIRLHSPFHTQFLHFLKNLNNLLNNPNFTIALNHQNKQFLIPFHPLFSDISNSMHLAWLSFEALPKISIIFKWVSRSWQTNPARLTHLKNWSECSEFLALCNTFQTNELSNSGTKA